MESEKEGWKRRGKGMNRQTGRDRKEEFNNTLYNLLVIKFSLHLHPYLISTPIQFDVNVSDNFQVSHNFPTTSTGNYSGYRMCSL